MLLHRNELNLFAFFRDVALRYQAECLGIDGMDPRRHAALDIELASLQQAYFKHSPVEYDSPDRKIAYTLHFAAKHAVIWRCIAKTLTTKDHDEWVLNSIGTGPGSELFGIMCGLTGFEKLRFKMVGLEAEESWRDMFDIARTVFHARTGILLNGFLTKDPHHLDPDGQPIGSFVLSDAARRHESGPLIESIRDSTKARDAIFLDFNTYMTSQGSSEFVNTPIQQSGFRVNYNSLRDDLDISKAIRTEMAGCSPAFCVRNVNEKLPLRLYTVHLR